MSFNEITTSNSMKNQLFSQCVSHKAKSAGLEGKRYYLPSKMSQSDFNDGLKRPASTPSFRNQPSPTLSPSNPSSSAKRTRHFSYGSATSASGYEYVLKIILLGDQGVGKSSYLRALRVHPDVAKVKCHCRPSHMCDHLEVEVITNNGKVALLKLCDTGGQERYRSLTSSYYRGAHGAILMLSLTNEKSLDNVQEWLSDLDTFCSESSCSRLLLGTNCTSPSRSIHHDTARSFAESRAMPYMEVDSNHFFNIVESIQLMVNRIVREVTMLTTKHQVIKPSLCTEEELRRKEDKFVCLC